MLPKFESVEPIQVKTLAEPGKQKSTNVLVPKKSKKPGKVGGTNTKKKVNSAVATNTNIVHMMSTMNSVNKKSKIPKTTKEGTVNVDKENITNVADNTNIVDNVDILDNKDNANIANDDGTDAVDEINTAATVDQAEKIEESDIVTISNSQAKKVFKSNKIDAINHAKKNDLMFVINFSLYTPASPNFLPEIFKIVMNSPDDMISEYIRKDSHANIKIDIDISNKDVDKELVIQNVLACIKDEIKKMGHTFDKKDDVYRSDSDDPNNGKQSSHILIRGKNFCFSTRTDIKNMMTKLNLPYVDVSIYRDTLIRCPYSSKRGQKRNMTPSNHLDQDKYELFLNNLAGYVTPNQKQNILKVEGQKLPSNVKTSLNSTTTSINDSLSNEELDLWKILGPDVRLSKKYIRNDYIYLYYTGKCILCNKYHTNQTQAATPCYVQVYNTLHNVLDIKFKCKTDQSNYVHYYLKRWNIKNINCTQPKLKTRFRLNNLISIVKYYGFDKGREVLFDSTNRLSGIEFEPICCEFLDANLIRDVMEKNDVVVIKSREGGNKTGAVLKWAKKDVLKTDHKFVGISPYVSTLANIHERTKEEDMPCSYYSSCTDEFISLGKYKMLLISINSICKLYNKSYNIKDLSKIILWNDETTCTASYFTSETLDGCRGTCYGTLKFMIEHCAKVIFTCADITSELCNILKSARRPAALITGKDYVPSFKVLCNTYTKFKKRFNIVTNLRKYKKILFECISLGENIYIPTDSRKVAIEIEAAIKEQFPNLPVLLLHRNSENKMHVLDNINEAVRNCRVFIASPTLAPGVSIDLMVDKNGNPVRNIEFEIAFPYFTRSMPFFTGNSLSPYGCQQMLNRVRSFTQVEHYIFFDKPVIRNLDSSIYNNDVLIKMFDLSKEEFVQKYHLNIERTLDRYGQAVFVPMDNFCTRLFLFNKRLSLEANKDFVSFVINLIIARGHKVVHMDIDLDFDFDVSSDFNIRKKMEESFVEYEKNKIVKLLSLPLITDEDAEKIKFLKKERSAISISDELQMEHWGINKRYRLDYDLYCDNVQARNVIANFIIEMQKKQFSRIMHNWICYFLPQVMHSSGEAKVIEDLNISKRSRLDKALNKIGFSSILDKSIIEGKKIAGMLFDSDEVEMLGKTFDDGRETFLYKAKKINNHMYINYISRLCQHMYGITIRSTENRKRRNGTQNRVRNYKLVFKNDVVKEYIVIVCTSYKPTLFRLYRDFVDDDVFNYTQIHGYTGLLNDCNVYEPILTRSKSAFIDDE